MQTSANSKPMELSNETIQRILDLIPHRREKAISVRTLCDITGYSHMTIKRAVHILRETYPICAQKDNGGGYWIAETEQEILEFIRYIRNRCNSHLITISNMCDRLEEMKKI